MTHSVWVKINTHTAMVHIENGDAYVTSWCTTEVGKPTVSRFISDLQDNRELEAAFIKLAKSKISK